MNDDQRPPEDFRFSVSVDGEHVDVVVAGDFDAHHVASVRAAIDPFVSETSRLRVDMSEATLIVSGALFGVVRYEPSVADLEIIAPKEWQRHLARVTGVEHLWTH